MVGKRTLETSHTKKEQWCDLFRSFQSFRSSFWHVIVIRLLLFHQYSPFYLTLIVFCNSDLFFFTFPFTFPFFIVVYSQFFFEWEIYCLVNRLSFSGWVPMCNVHPTSFPWGPCLWFLTSTPPLSAAELPAEPISAELQTAVWTVRI